MTDAILCSPHHEDGRAVYGQRIIIAMTITGTDGETEELSGEFDLCDSHATRRLGSVIEQLRVASAPPVLVGEVVSIEPPEPTPPPPPAPPAAQVVQQQDTFMCGQCVKPVPYMSRGRHARKDHDCKVWEIRWLPLFDISGWPVCKECGLAIGTSSGMSQHEKKAGPPHRRAPEPYTWGPEDMETPMGAAFARAVGK